VRILMEGFCVFLPASYRIRHFGHRDY
jgi:hypothetical protein